MATIDRQELDRLERRELQLTIVAAVFVFVLASGLAVFMYPMVFVHPDTANKWTLRVAFFGFCVLTLLFIGYLLERSALSASSSSKSSKSSSAISSCACKPAPICYKPCRTSTISGIASPWTIAAP